MACAIITRDFDHSYVYEEVDLNPISFDGEYFWFVNDGDDESEVGISLEELEKAMDFYDILMEMGEI